ncbi:MAG TPA: hypothetical protein VF636_09595 [Sphingomonas sp.]|jgi:hypothetical protein
MWLLVAFIVGTIGLCWFVFVTFYRSDYGPRPMLATGCTFVVLLGCLCFGFWLLMMMAIGGAVTL